MTSIISKYSEAEKMNKVPLNFILTLL
ncbi:Protein CBG25410 [Caenorhabditis briggsae]|uniref:Protein CBG25410 n=1 Tax=Caenorhabditis briggsae TaxID=6238 RepID=B6IE92_CAEBR|nr:Protein CBG25410 [Caenorhabditis briggsae]CAS01156.1 Protein CBG25410 [Caenorhabditis briggsae]